MNRFKQVLCCAVVLGIAFYHGFHWASSAINVYSRHGSTPSPPVPPHRLSLETAIVNGKVIYRLNEGAVVVQKYDSVEPSTSTALKLGHVLEGGSHVSDGVDKDEKDNDCGVDPCRFILPARIDDEVDFERNSLHLYQLGLMALLLNRTLVLPTIAPNMSFLACGGAPFSYLMDEEYFNSNGILTIEQEPFKLWTSLRKHPTSAQYVSLGVAHPSAGEHETIEFITASSSEASNGEREEDPFPPQHACLKELSLDTSNYRDLSIKYLNQKKKSRFLDRVMDALENGFGASRVEDDADDGTLTDTRPTSPDVLVIDYGLVDYVFPMSVFARYVKPRGTQMPLLHLPIPLASRWKSVSEDIVSRLETFVAVQWQATGIDPSTMAMCGMSLVHVLKRLKTEHPTLGSVYMITDYPNDQVLRSAEKKGSNDQFAFTQAFNDVGLGMRLTAHFIEDPKLTIPESSRVEKAVTALIGMIDEEVAKRASLFVFASESGRVGHQCGRPSEGSKRATQRIFNARKPKSDASVWNVGEGFTVTQGG